MTPPQPPAYTPPAVQQQPMQQQPLTPPPQQQPLTDAEQLYPVPPDQTPTPGGAYVQPQGSNAPPQQGQAPGAFGHDPFTGQVSDINALLGYLSENQSGRQRLFSEQLAGSSGYQNAPGHVRSFLNSRFDPLNSQYLAQAAVNPGQGAGGNFNDYLSQNQNTLDPKGWRDLYGGIRDTFGGVDSASALSALEGQSGVGGGQGAAYEMLRGNGLGIMQQAARANLNPALARASDRVLNQRFTNFGAASEGAPSNQAEFVRQQDPFWRSILGG